MADVEVFDYVIVGAGSAGCVLAARLTEDPSVAVLLLEAGPSDDVDAVKIPAAFSTLFRTTRDWDFRTTAQKHAQGRALYWPRGKVVGGSSSINAMIYIRGNQLDYDSWRDDYGCDGWGYSDLLPYFKRAEDNSRGVSHAHGVGGPLRVEDLRAHHELTQAFVASAVEAGHGASEDFNAGEQEGVGFYQVTQRRGHRWSAAEAYLRPALERPNLTLRIGQLVTRIELRDGRAVGVTVVPDGGGEPRVIRADREVLVAAGAVGSPHLLLRSGIGPAHHLSEVGVPVELDLPGVGENLHDHPAAPVVWMTTGTTSLHDHENIAQLLRWRLTGGGPLASNVAEAGGFWRSHPQLPAPDLQWHAAAAAFIEHGLVEPPGPGFSTGPTLVAPHSRGTLRLASADPRHRPLIDPQYLSDDRDLVALVAGVRETLNVALHDPIARFLGRRLMPIDSTSDEALADHVRSQVQTLYHPVGTCSMGVSEQSVVDLDCRVRGVHGLRVIDASVMPVVPRGNTNAPTIAVAERASDLVRGRTPIAALG